MRQVLIISYDLSNPGRDYSVLVARIKEIGPWARLGGSAYLVASNEQPAQVRDALSPALDSNDKLFVGTCPAPAAWKGYPDEVSRWIHKHQLNPEA